VPGAKLSVVPDIDKPPVAIVVIALFENISNIAI
jgi:hypothetical protein